MVKTSIRFFNNKEVRAAWDDATGKWRFCAVDVAAALSGSVEFRRILTGLAYRVWNVAKPSLPLASYCNHMFKLFGVDVGLLAAQSRLAPSVVLEGNRAFTEFKGALTEQFVQQELRAAAEIVPYTWAPNDSTAEIDFLVETANGIVPVEAKAERNLQAKSLGVYREKFSPQLALRTSLSDPKSDRGLVDVPLYAFGPRVLRLATPPSVFAADRPPCAAGAIYDILRSCSPETAGVDL